MMLPAASAARSKLCQSKNPPIVTTPVIPKTQKVKQHSSGLNHSKNRQSPCATPVTITYTSPMPTITDTSVPNNVTSPVA